MRYPPIADGRDRRRIPLGEVFPGRALQWQDYADAWLSFPWKPRVKTEYRGLAAPVAAIARGTYRVSWEAGAGVGTGFRLSPE